MKKLINDLLEYLWCVRHMTKAYWNYNKEMAKDPHLIKEYYLADVPTHALEYYLELVDGKQMNNRKLNFTLQCKREWEFRERITFVEHGV